MTRHIGDQSIALEDLTPFPGNARRGNVDVILDSLRANGQYKPVVVRQDGDDRIILAGNHTYLALLRHEENDREACEDWQQTHERHCQLCVDQDVDEPAALAHVIECDEPTAARINLADNKTADEGDYDDAAVNAILASLDGDLVGTGYSASEAEMFDSVAAVPDVPPSLDDLAEEYGEPQETDLWPVIRVRVPPNVRDDFMALTEDCDDPADDSVRFMHLVQRVRAA